MKKNTRNLNVFHSESKRDSSGNLILTLECESTKRKPSSQNPLTTVNATIPFDLLPYILRKMQKTWLIERDARLQQIAQNDEFFINHK